MPRLAPLVAALAIAGCFRTASDPALVARVEALEAREEARTRALLDAQPQQLEVTVLARKLEDLRAQLEVIERKLEATAARPAAKPSPVRRRTPDPALTYAVPVGTSPVAGPPDAKVTVVMAYELACPYCHRAWSTLEDLRAKYGNELRIVYKPYIVHRTNATYAAYAACAAHRQGKWRPMVERLWEKMFVPRKFDAATVDAIAREVRLNMRRYKHDVAATCPQEVDDERALLTKLGVTATPTFFINGRFMAGARPQAEFERLIDEELAEARDAIQRGVEPAAFYDQEIVGKGIREIPLP